MDKCKGCLWYGSCYTAKNDCEHYTPADEQEMLDEYIEARSKEFREEWMTYSGEYSHWH